jgi:anhydro-N-acetylmuramic acid kinase
VLPLSGTFPNPFPKNLSEHERIGCKINPIGKLTELMTRVIGLISGTSVDGIDAAMVDITGTESDLQVEWIAGTTYPYPEPLRQKILAVCAGDAISMAEFAELDDAIAQTFAHAALTLQGNHPVELIGSHGQTVYHRPPQTPQLGYSLQLGRGAVIAQLTGIPTITNFRAGDIAAGGQGAPLVPKVDLYLLGDRHHYQCVQNIGGIGNVAFIPPQQNSPSGGSDSPQMLGWDTGPGNSLIDLAVEYLTNGEATYDRDGAWAAQGVPCQPLLDHWLQHPFFHEPPPKSTGRELFGWDYFRDCLSDAEPYSLSPEDLLATLTELTVEAIAINYRCFLPVPPTRVLLCGGGSRNRYLKQRLQTRLQEIYGQSVAVLTTDDRGVNADFKEAIAFAVLAYWRQQGIPGNLPECTGAKVPALLGEIHTPKSS